MQSRSTSDSGSGGDRPTANEFKHKYCRLCGVELTCGVFIYGEEGRGLQLADKIRKTLSILVLEEDALPKKICTDCCTSLEDYSNYREAVVDVQAKLKAIAQADNGQPHNHSPPRSVSQLGQSAGAVRDGINIANGGGTTAASRRAYREGTSSATTQGQRRSQVSLSSSSTSCAICGAAFSTDAALDVHINAEHASSTVDSPNQEEEAIELHIPSPAPSEEPRLVEEDGKSPLSVSTSQESLNNVIASTSHSQEGASPSNVVPASPATASDNSMSGKPTAKNKSTYHCFQCNKILESQSGYYSHVMVVHKGRRFRCNQCENTYCNKYSLKYHQQSTHAATSSVQSPTTSSSSTVKPLQFECPECPKFFRTKQRLYQHKKTHTNLRPFECTVCHKFFKTNKCLRNHMGYHEGSRKKFSCLTCDKQFTKSRYLEEHKKLHLPDKKLACPLCPLTFSGFPNYSKHVRRVHAAKIGLDGKIPKALTSKADPTTVNDTESKPLKAETRAPCSSRQAQNTSASTQNVSSYSVHSQPAAESSSCTPSNSASTAASSNGPLNQAHQVENQNHPNSWTESAKGPPVNQAQLVRLHPNQTQQYSMNVMQQSQPQIQQQHSIPIIPMDDMVDSVIQTALLSHPHSLDSSSHPHGHSHMPSMQTYNSQHTHRAQNNHSSVSNAATPNHSSAYQVMQSNEINKINYVGQFDETPLELCVRNNGEEDSTGENETDKRNNYSQLVDLTSAKIVDLSGVGLVMAAAASSSNNIQSSPTPNNTSSSMIYRQAGQQQQLSTMSIVQMSMLPMDLTDQQQQASAGMESSEHTHIPLALTSNQSANHSTSTLMNSNLVDLSYTGASNRTGNHFQMQQHQDEQMMSTSTFFRELLDLSCSTSTTRGLASTSTSMDTYAQHPHLQQQTHFQSQQVYQQPAPQAQYQQSPQHQPSQTQQYELNLSSKSRGYGMGQYQQQGQAQSMSGQGHSQSQTSMYQQNQHQHSQSLGHTNGTSTRSSSTATANSNGGNSNNATTNQFHNVMYNDTLFM